MTAALILWLAMVTAAPTTGPSASLQASPTPAASPTATAAPITAWLGATLGESPKDLRAQLGKPREILPASIGDLWRYDTDSGNATLEIVVDQDQVVSIAVRSKIGKQSTLADPVGGALGMTAQALQTARGTPIATYDNGGELAYGDPYGVQWFYSLDGGIVIRISINKPLPPAVEAQVISDTAHDGSDLAKAFVVKATHQTDATNAELSFLHTLVCDVGGSWQVAGQELVTAAGGYYDLYHVTCSTTKKPHDYYFDVSSSFGK